MMRRRTLAIALPRLSAVLAALMVSACGGPENPRLMNVPRSSTGPDEFLVVPAKPLETPPQARALPPPTPGLANRADPTPLEDAVAALGGNPSRVRPTGAIPGSEAGLVGYASRLGRDPAIRQTLAQEDLEFRRGNNGRLLERLAGVSVYYDAYEDQSLDQRAEAERFRRAGLPTPAAPPEGIEADQSGRLLGVFGSGN